MDRNIVKAPAQKLAAEKQAAEKTEGYTQPFELAHVGTPCSEAEKEAAISWQTVKQTGKAMGGRMLGATGQTLAAASMLGVGMGIANVITNAAAQAITAARTGNVLDKALEKNPKLRSIPRETLEEYLDIIMKASPTVAESPLLLANYLQYMIDHEGSVNFMAFKQLADVEGQVARNRSEASPFGPMAQKAMFETTMRHSF